MPQTIFVNLPVADLARSVAFYESVGARKIPHFSDDTGACVAFSDTIHVMLLTHAKFGQFTTKPIADPRAATQVLISLSADSREDVDRTVEAAGRAGGGIDPSPVEDYSFMYGRSYEDPDGHAWGIFWMDPATAAGAPVPEEATA